MYTTLVKKKPKVKHVIDGANIYSTAIKSTTPTARLNNQCQSSTYQNQPSNTRKTRKNNRNQSDDSDDERECRSKWVIAYNTARKISKTNEVKSVSESVDDNYKLNNSSKKVELSTPVYPIDSDTEKNYNDSKKKSSVIDNPNINEDRELDVKSNGKEGNGDSIKACNEKKSGEKESKQLSSIKSEDKTSVKKKSMPKHTENSQSDSEVVEISLAKRNCTSPKAIQKKEKPVQFDRDIYPKRANYGTDGRVIKKIELEEIEATLNLAPDKTIPNESINQDKTLNLNNKLTKEYIEFDFTKFGLLTDKKGKTQANEDKNDHESNLFNDDEKLPPFADKEKIIEAFGLVFSTDKKEIEKLLTICGDDYEKLKNHFIGLRVDELLNRKHL